MRDELEVSLQQRIDHVSELLAQIAKGAPDSWHLEIRKAFRNEPASNLLLGFMSDRVEYPVPTMQPLAMRVMQAEIDRRIPVEAATAAPRIEIDQSAIIDEFHATLESQELPRGYPKEVLTDFVLRTASELVGVKTSMLVYLLLHTHTIHPVPQVRSYVLDLIMRETDRRIPKPSGEAA